MGLKLPTIPRSANQAKQDAVKKAPALSGKQTDLGTIETARKSYTPNIPRSQLVPHARKAVKDEQVEKRGAWYDTIIPDMFLDAEYICDIIRTTNKKGDEVVEYDWKILPAPVGVTYKQPVSHFYIDSYGDLSMAGMYNGTIITYTIFNDENCLKQQALLDAHNKSTSTTRKRTTTSDTTGLVEICTLSYGDYRDYFKDAEHLGVNLNDYIHYERRDYKYIKDGKEKVKYCGALMSFPENVDMLTSIIKLLGKDRKSIVFNH